MTSPHTDPEERPSLRERCDALHRRLDALDAANRQEIQRLRAELHALRCALGEGTGDASLPREAVAEGDVAFEVPPPASPPATLATRSEPVDSAAASSGGPKPSRSPAAPLTAELVEHAHASYAQQPTAAPSAESPAAPPAEPAATAARWRRAESLEAKIGGHWLTWAGSLVLLVAVGLGVHWAWTTFETPAWLQVLWLHLLGMGVLAAGVVAHRRRLPLLSQSLTGLGIFTLYCVAVASLRLYEIWPASVANWEFLLITTLAIAMALWLNSAAVVVVGALGGYLTPFFTSQGTFDHHLIFTYLAFLNVALVGSAVWRGWSFLKPLALVCTAPMFLLWLADGYRSTDHLWSTQWYVALHALIFLLGTTLPPWLWRRGSTASDLFTLSANASWFLGITYLLFHREPEQQLALVCWALAAGHLGLFAVTRLRVDASDRMPRVQLALAAALATLAPPLQLDEMMYLGPAWCAEGLAFLLVGIYYRDFQMRVSSLVVFLLAGGKFAFDYLEPASTLMGTSLDTRFVTMFTGGAMMIAAGAMHLLLRDRLASSLRQGEQWLLPAVPLALGNLLLMLALTCQWQGRMVLVLWTLDVAVVWALGFRFDSPAARTYGLLLAVLMVGAQAVYLFDSIEGGYRPLLNDRMGSLLWLAIVYFAAGWGYYRLGQRHRSKQVPGPPWLEIEPMAHVLLGIAANLVLVSALSWELSDWIDAHPQVVARWTGGSTRMARMAGYSILWSLYAAALVAVGFAMRYRLFRLLGLAAFVPILAKVFLVDLAGLEVIARVAAFAVLGMMLLGVSWLYQRFTSRVVSP